MPRGKRRNAARTEAKSSVVWRYRQFRQSFFLDALQQSLLGVADLSAGHTEKRPPLFVQVVPVLGQLLGEVFSGNPAKGDDRQSKPLDRGDARLGPRLGLRLMRFGRLAGLELGHEERPAISMIFFIAGLSGRIACMLFLASAIRELTSRLSRAGISCFRQLVHCLR